VFVHWKRRALKPGAVHGCPHDAPGRQALTAMLIWSYRPKGSATPRHRKWKVAPAIRTCCVDVPHVLVAWWEDALRIVREHAPAEQRAALRVKLSEVVRLPAAAELEVVRSERLELQRELGVA
jgi:hypothetical protein